eukprot:213626-Chlamydomonas_euryale.AAC.1
MPIVLNSLRVAASALRSSFALTPGPRPRASPPGLAPGIDTPPPPHVSLLSLFLPQEEVICIDFPQMVSVSHPNAEELFDRDVECIVRFFSKKVGYQPENDPDLPYVRPSLSDAIAEIDEALDIDLAASGFQ